MTAKALPARSDPAALDAEDRELLKKAKGQWDEDRKRWKIKPDTEAINRLIEEHQPLIQKIAAKTKRRYEWIDADDLAQCLSLTVYRHIRRFDLSQTKNTWRKYSYFRLHGEAQQWLRELDPLGIKWPHRKAYPKHSHFGQLSGDDSGTAESFVAVSRDETLGFDILDLHDSVAAKVDVDPDCLYALIVLGWDYETLSEHFMPMVASETIAVAMPLLEAELTERNHSQLLARWICDAIKELLDGSHDG